VLLADDHVVVRQSLRQYLEHERDINVVGEAGDGEEAVRLAEQLKPEVTIVDIAMPNVNGIEATKRIKELCPTTSVLALTAYDYEQYVFALLEAGAAGYLLKDVSGKELVDAIRAVRRGDCVLHPAIARKVLTKFRQTGGEPAAEAKKSLLTAREREVLKRAAKGMWNKQIAEELFLSLSTVEAHLSSIFNKLGVGSRTEAVVCGLRKGLLSLEDLDINEASAARH
ncbi:MAG: response regulator transcription factor, partial [Chloroflexi bacterium]|nr:response regulator transcription factor [Chloroflexota bacterium]